MSVLGVGVDLVPCERIGRMLRDHGDAFLERLYTPREREFCLEPKDPVPRLAGRFAAKEAVLKSLGTGWRGGILWTDVETLPDALGRPVVTLRGKAGELAGALGVTCVLVSISHAGDYAVASATALANAAASVETWPGEALSPLES